MYSLHGRVDVLARIVREADANDVAVTARMRAVAGRHIPTDAAEHATLPSPFRYELPDPASDSYRVHAGYGNPSSFVYNDEIKLDLAVDPPNVPLPYVLPFDEAQPYLNRDFLKERWRPDGFHHTLEDIQVHLDIVANGAEHEILGATLWARRQADELLRMASIAEDLANDLDTAALVLGPSKNYAYTHAGKTAEMARYGDQLAEAARREYNRRTGKPAGTSFPNSMLALVTSAKPAPPIALANRLNQIDTWLETALEGGDPIALRYVLVAERDQLNVQRGALWRHAPSNDERAAARYGQ